MSNEPSTEVERLTTRATKGNALRAASLHVAGCLLQPIRFAATNFLGEEILCQNDY
jgi:hypothetical protein